MLLKSNNFVTSTFYIRNYISLYIHVLSLNAKVGGMEAAFLLKTVFFQRHAMLKSFY